MNDYISIDEIIRGYPPIPTKWKVDRVNNKFYLYARDLVGTHAYNNWVSNFIKDSLSWGLIDAWGRPFIKPFEEVITCPQGIYTTYKSVTTVDGWDVEFVVEILTLDVYYNDYNEACSDPDSKNHQMKTALDRLYDTR